VSETDEIQYDIRGTAAWITITRPGASNALSLSAGAGIRDALSKADSDSSVCAIVVTGAGDKVFSAGADLKELPPTRRDPAEAEAYDRLFDETMSAVDRCRKPTIARLNGHVVGGGISLALACDIRIATDRARFRVPVARLGFMYTPDQTSRLVRAIGPSRTKWLVFSSEAITAGQALEWGLVDQVVPDDAFVGACDNLINTICSGAPLTQKTMKQIINTIDDGTPLDSEQVTAAYHKVYGSEDLNEGLAAAAEKRDPVFKGG